VGGAVTEVSIDIATRFLGVQEDIYIIRPGEAFSLYDAFEKRSSVFLDFPDLRIPLGGPKPNRTALREAVVRSAELQKWYTRGQQGPEPSRNPLDYQNAANGRRIGRYVAAIERLYFELPPGTIVVVPGSGYFANNTLIGELVGGAEETKGVGPLAKESYPARRVNWIARRPKAYFSQDLRERLQKPLLMMAADRSLRSEILKAAYGQYVVGNQYSSRLRTTEADFSTLDDFDIQTVVNCVCGLLAAVDEGKDLKNVSLYDAIELLYERRDLIPELAANINSPGDLRLFSETLAPLVVGLIIAVALASPVGAKPTDIRVTNSRIAGNDPCALVVQEKAKKVVEMMDLDAWQKICTRTHEVHKKTGLTSSIMVKRDGAKP
jgi:hypothetical protein